MVDVGGFLAEVTVGTHPHNRAAGGTVFCYICSRPFGSHSIKIHEPQCLKRWIRENEKLPKSRQRPMPHKPTILEKGGPVDPDELNEIAWKASQEAMLPCEGCGRKFKDFDRLQVHFRSCKAAQEIQAHKVEEQKKHDREEYEAWEKKRHADPHDPELMSAEKDSEQRRNDPVFCYICARPFGSQSIKIHEPQCLKKWHNENDRLPPKLRRQPPHKPTILDSGEPISREMMNEIAWRAGQESMLPCDGCGRRFKDMDRLEVHQRSCKGAEELKQQRIAEHRKQEREEYEAWDKKRHGEGDASDQPGASRRTDPVFCYICARPFGSQSIKIHEPQCLKKWHHDNNKLPKHLRRQPPHKPTILENGGLSREAMNEVAWKAGQEAMIACDGCGRRFKDLDRVEKHQKSCKAAEELKEKREEEQRKHDMEKWDHKGDRGGSDGHRNEPVFCYICSRPFGSHSIGIHEPKCLERWHIENERLPANLRRNPPHKPTLLESGEYIDPGLRNQLAFQAAQDSQIACDKCGRTFSDVTRLTKHQKSCDGQGYKGRHHKDYSDDENEHRHRKSSSHRKHSSKSKRGSSFGSKPRNRDTIKDTPKRSDSASTIGDE